MKSITLVIIHENVHSISEALNSSLEPHRLDEDDPQSVSAHHWDYWHRIDDPRNEINYAIDCLDSQETDRESLKICNLPTDYIPGAIIDIAGTWHDLQDFGWRLIDGECKSNSKAIEKWKIHAKALLSQNTHNLGIPVLTHC